MTLRKFTKDYITNLKIKSNKNQDKTVKKRWELTQSPKARDSEEYQEEILYNIAIQLAIIQKQSYIKLYKVSSYIKTLMKSQHIPKVYN